MNEWTQCEAAEGVLLRITVGPGGISSIEINPRRSAVGTRNDENLVLAKAVAQLREYFAGRLRQFDLPLAPQGTAFQREVWKALSAIPYGQTRTYREIAEAVGAPRAVRAVGAANSRNTLPIVVPCHRVIGADGRLVGYAGGVTVKKMLLDLEASHAAGKAATEAASV